MEEKIIEFMRENSFLYDVSEKNYKCLKLKELKWNELSKEVNVQVGELKKKWKVLKDYFYREEKKRSLPSGSGASKGSTWKYYESLMFLKNSRPKISTDSNHEELSRSSTEILDEDMMFLEEPFDEFSVEPQACSTPETPPNVTDRGRSHRRHTTKTSLQKEMLIKNTHAQINKLIDVFENKVNEKSSATHLFFESCASTVEKSNLDDMDLLNLQKDVLEVIGKYLKKC